MQMAGLLDYLYNPSTYGGDPGLLSRLAPSLGTITPSAGFQDPQAQPLAIGSYQMPRIGNPDQFQPQQALLPANAQPTQGQDPTQVQQPAQPLPPALGGGFTGGNIGASLQSFANTPGGVIPKLVGGLSTLISGQRTDPAGVAQQNLKAQYDSLVPVLGPQKAMLAVLNPEAGKVILQEALTDKEKYTKTGQDAFGNEQYGFVNERDQTVNGKPVGQGAQPATGGGFLAPGVTSLDSTLTGADYLKQFSPEIQAAVTNYIDGKSTPTGNPRKGFTQTVKMIAQKYGADIGQPADDANYMARRTMRNQLSSSAPSTLGGQINIGNTAAGHLADLTQRALDLDNSNGFGIPMLAHGVNEARGFLSTEQSAKMEALKGAAQHYGQEITKFYAGSPGGVAERDRFIESVNGAKSPKELAAILATEGELMRSRLDALGGQIRGVLGEEGLKQYPVLRPDGQAALAKVEENVSKLKGVQSAPASTLPQGWSVKVR